MDTCTIGRCKVIPDPGRKMCPEHLAYYREYNTRRSWELRKEVFAAYGGKCGWCGEDDRLVLELHHINHDSLPKGDRKGSNKFLYKLKREGFPPYVMLVCANCHCKHHRLGMFRDV